MSRLLALAALVFALPAPAEVTIEWVTVGDAGNAADTTGHGSVGYRYQIGKYEVTNAQYAEFLNAVAANDTYDLYNGSMATGYGGITRSGEDGSYTYSTIAGRENMPVNVVSFWDALRFANWLHNGQPTGAQDGTTTEDGAYTITQEGIDDNTITRNAGATVFVTSEDEWYKAAYYKGGGIDAGYYDYPAGSDALPTCTVPGATANAANCDLVVHDVTGVGSYTGAASPSGTFDQGGNVYEWNETIVSGSGRLLRGGDWIDWPDALAAWWDSWAVVPTAEDAGFGFRVASPVPALPVPALGPIGLLLIATALLGAGACGRRRA